MAVDDRVETSSATTNYDSTSSIFAQIEHSISSILAANFRSHSVRQKEYGSTSIFSHANKATSASVKSSPVVAASARLKQQTQKGGSKSNVSSDASSNLFASIYSFKTAPTSPVNLRDDNNNTLYSVSNNDMELTDKNGNE